MNIHFPRAYRIGPATTQRSHCSHIIFALALAFAGGPARRIHAAYLTIVHDGAARGTIDVIAEDRHDAILQGIEIE